MLAALVLHTVRSTACSVALLLPSSDRLPNQLQLLTSQQGSLETLVNHHSAAGCLQNAAEEQDCCCEQQYHTAWPDFTHSASIMLACMKMWDLHSSRAAVQHKHSWQHHLHVLGQAFFPILLDVRLAFLNLSQQRWLVHKPAAPMPLILQHAQLVNGTSCPSIANDPV